MKIDTKRVTKKTAGIIWVNDGSTVLVKRGITGVTDMPEKRDGRRKAGTKLDE